MEKRNPTQSPLPPLIDFLQIYTIHEYIYIYTHVCICYLYFRRPFWGCFDPRRQWPPWPQTETEVETQKDRKSRQNEDWNRLRFSLSRLRREGLKESVTPPHAQCVRACVCIRQIHIYRYWYIYISLCLERWTWQVESTCAGRCTTTSTSMRVSDGYIEPRPSRATRTLHLTVSSF